MLQQWQFGNRGHSLGAMVRSDRHGQSLGEAYTGTGYDWTGFIMLAEGHPKEASAVLEKMPPTSFDNLRLWQRLALSTALERQGNLNAAISKLSGDIRRSTRALSATSGHSAE